MPVTLIVIEALLLLCLLEALYLWFMIRKNGDWLELALTGMGDAVLITDRKGRITRLNTAAEALTGWKSGKARGKPSAEVLRIVDHDSRAPAPDPVEQALKTGSISGWVKNTMLLLPAGDERPIDHCAAPVLGRRGRIRAIILIFRDNTGRYLAEQQLRESEERMRAITNATQLGLVMIDRDRRYVYANKFYLQMVGVSDVNLIGRRVIEVLPLVYEQIRPNLDRAFAGERVSYEVKGVNNKEKGLNRIYSVTYEPQMRQSLVVHVVIVVLDITQMRQVS